jgi:hypothetical protein
VKRAWKHKSNKQDGKAHIKSGDGVRLGVLFLTF